MSWQDEKQEVMIPMEIEALNEEIKRIRQVIKQTTMSAIKDALEAAVKLIENNTIKLRNQMKCTCDWEYEEADPDCLACLNQYRNERYGYDVHDVQCGCNACNGYSRQW